MKAIIGLFFVLCAFSNVYAFEGVWNVDNSQCTNSGNYVSEGYTYNNVRCDVHVEKVVLAYNSAQNTIGVKFLLSGGGYPTPIWDEQTYGTFDCHNPDCWPMNRNHWGELKILNDDVTYSNKNLEGGRSRDGSYEYYFDLNKIDSNHYRLVRRLKYDYSYAKYQDTTQVLNLSR